MAKWVKVSDELPPTGQTVLTRILDSFGSRNETELIFDRMWWLKDRSMYVYYNPTHWLKEEE